MGAGRGGALGEGLLQRWQQALLCQVSLQGVEDVELLIDTQGQELLDHLAGVGAPERREEGNFLFTFIKSFVHTVMPNDRSATVARRVPSFLDYKPRLFSHNLNPAA